MKPIYDMRGLPRDVRCTVIANYQRLHRKYGIFNCNFLMENEREIRFKTKVTSRHSIMYYLYDGTGKPCAGHKSGKVPFVDVMRPFILLTLGNFGRTLPTGSGDGLRDPKKKRERKENT